MKPASFIAVLGITIFSVTTSLAQSSMDEGIFKPGTTAEMSVHNIEPVCWLNAANEFNVYIKNDTSATLLTLQNETAPKIGTLPNFWQVTITDYSFILSTKDKQDYYFAVESLEEKQFMEIFESMHPVYKQKVYGYGLAKHNLGNRKITLEQLKAAKSVYDVLEKL